MSSFTDNSIPGQTFTDISSVSVSHTDIALNDTESAFIKVGGSVTYNELGHTYNEVGIDYLGYNEVNQPGILDKQLN